MVSRHWRFPAYSKFHHRENIKSTKCDEIKKRTDNPQKIRAKKPGTNPPIKVLSHCHHWVRVLTHRRAISEEWYSYAEIGFKRGMQTLVKYQYYSIIYITFDPWHEISNNVVRATSKGSDQPAHTRRLIRAFASRLNILWLLSYWPNIIWSF